MTRLQGAVASDRGDTRVLTLDGISSLSDVTAVEAHVWGSATAPIILAATVLSAVDRTVTVQLGAAGGWLSTAAPGTYSFEVQCTFTGGIILTWPNGDPDTITVRAQGG